MLVDFGLNRHLREKRAAVRIAVKARVCLSHSTFGVIHTHTRNISDTGVFVELTNKPHLPVGAHLKMQMLDSALPESVTVRRVAVRGLRALGDDHALTLLAQIAEFDPDESVRQAAHA